jgi:hypothetical protein
MKSPDELALAAELRALRPAPRPEFVSELDARAAAGFPRKRRGGALGERLSAAASHLRISPRRLLAPAGGLAVASILVATVVVLNSDHANVDSGPVGNRSEQLSGSRGSAGGAKAETSGAPADHGSVMFSEEPPVVPGHKGAAAPAASSGGGEAAESLSSGTSRPETGPYASQAAHRDVERSAEMVLGTDPADVRRAAGKVFEAVHAYDGIVLESSIEDGGEGEAGASFELLIPSAKLGDALASFSSIAEVRSRQESTADVTAKTVGLGERLQDSRATIDGLLEQLATADTDGERAAAEAELHSERLRAAALRANLADLQRRANLSQVSLKIESGEEGAAAPDKGGSWGIGDALGDAGHILEVAAGVTLIGLAILAPFALLALLAWLTRRGGVRRARERALS